MKKLFFFRSHSNNSTTNNNQCSPTSTDKQVSWEQSTDSKVDKPAKNKPGSEDPVFGSTPCLRRSLSFSSGSLYDSGEEIKNNADQTRSPFGVSYYSNKQRGHRSSRSRPPTPEKQTSSKFADNGMVRNAHGVEKFGGIFSRANSDLSEISYYSSSNVSNKVLDRYIDGEQQTDEMRESRTNFSMKNQFDTSNAVVKRPPGLKFTAVRDARKQKPKSQSFRESKTSSKDGVDSGYCDESPRKLAKHVIERLSKSQFSPETRSKEFDRNDCPITIEDVYGRMVNRCYNAHSDEQTSDGSRPEEISELSEKDSEDIDAVTNTDLELFKKYKESKDRVAILSEELEKGNFFQYRGLSVPASVDLNAQIRRLEREKNELQLALEKELDRRSNEWSLKLDKLQAEEHRLRERVRELAEQNVCLQREVSSCSEREIEARTKITFSEKQLGDLSIQVKEAIEENQYLRKTLSEIEEKARAAEADRDCVRRNYEEKVIECKDMHRSISRLQITCNDQEKTIVGLRGLCEALGNKISGENFDFGSAKLQVEHMRLTGVEHTLRKEIESYRGEVDSLRCENIDLLNHLKNDSEEDGGFSTFKLDRELQSRISCLQNKILPLLTESSRIGRKLVEFVKINGQDSATCLDVQSLVECEVKLQGFERAAENITISLQTASGVLQEKAKLCHEKYCSGPGSGDESHKRNEQKSEEMMRSALKAETLLTSLLSEKLYSKELDLEQMQVELAAAVRANDVLKCELQNAVDSFSCVNHKMKELELQMMKKDETVNKVQCDLQECRKEWGVLRGILPKVSEERDMLWEEVKRYSEKNMLMNSEINALRNKIEALDEDILVKEGQITILKDSLGKPFDLLASPDSTDIFR